MTKTIYDVAKAAAASFRLFVTSIYRDECLVQKPLDDLHSRGVSGLIIVSELLSFCAPLDDQYLARKCRCRTGTESLVPYHRGKVSSLSTRFFSQNWLYVDQLSLCL